MHLEAVVVKVKESVGSLRSAVCLSSLPVVVRDVTDEGLRVPGPHDVMAQRPGPLGQELRHAPLQMCAEWSMATLLSWQHRG